MHGTITKSCRVCSKPFKAKRASAEFCAPRCRVKFNRHPGWYPALSVTDHTPHHFPGEGQNRALKNQGVSTPKNGLSVTPTGCEICGFAGGLHYCSCPHHVIREELGIVWRVVAGPPIHPLARAEMGPIDWPRQPPAPKDRDTVHARAATEEWVTSVQRDKAA